MSGLIFGLCLLMTTPQASGAVQQPANRPAPNKIEQDVITLSKDKWGWMSERKAIHARNHVRGPGGFMVGFAEFTS